MNHFISLKKNLQTLKMLGDLKGNQFENLIKIAKSIFH